MERRVIFLDIDGVLRSVNHTKLVLNMNIRNELIFAPDAVGHLNALTRMTGAKIVLHSQWRTERTATQCANWLKEHGVCGHCIGKTEYLDKPKYTIGHEIRLWLQTHADCRFIILDDCPASAFFPSQAKRLVVCDSYTGFGFKEFVKSYQLLTGKNPWREEKKVGGM